MAKSWKKALFVFSVAVVLLGCWRTSASKESNAPSAKCILCIFLREKELMTRENWHSKPLDVRTAEKNVGRYDAFWCSQIMAQYNRPVWEFLRRNRPDQIMLYYITGTGIRKTDVRTYFDYDYIESYHPEWFLLKDARNATLEDYKDKDKRIRWAPSDPTSSYYHQFYIDVTNKDFQKWAADQILAFVSGKKGGVAYSYDGLAMDNVYVGGRLHQRFRNKYPHWKYASNFKSWSEGFGEYLKTVKKVLNQHGFILVVNHNPVGRDRSNNQEVWDILYESADGILTEQALRSGWRDSSYFADDEWLAAMARHEEILEKGLINWWACLPPQSSSRAHDVFLYTYCSWLLIKKPGKSFYSAAGGSVASKRTVLWYDAYDLAIGTPTSRRYPQNGCWFRDYSSAKIVVNPTRTVRRVVIDNEKPWLDWKFKKQVRELAIPPQSGRILLPISQGATGRH